jgi:hypothetical protein
LTGVYNFVDNLKKDIIENLKATIKKQSNEAKDLNNEGKKLNQDCKNLLESLEKLKKNYLNQAKDTDTNGIEFENMNCNREISNEKKGKMSQKY